MTDIVSVRSYYPTPSMFIMTLRLPLISIEATSIQSLIMTIHLCVMSTTSSLSALV